MKLNEWVNNYIKEVTHSHEYEDMSQMGEDENDPQEISVGNYQTKYFHVCPGASNLYKDIESKGVDMDMAERSARLQDALYFVEEHIQRDGYKPERDYVMVAKNIAKNIMKMAEMMGLEKEHDYIQGHVDIIEKVVKEKGLEERVMELTEENVPTNPSKWSYYKSQAKKKFDVYPSAYANAWAAKQYKAAGGGWKTKKKESLEEMDINDPIMMKLRAAQMRKNKQAAKKIDTEKQNKNATKIKALKKKRAEVMRDMEQEAEPEGGKIADRYGKLLNKIDNTIIKLGGNPMSESVNEAQKVNPTSKKFLKGMKKIKVKGLGGYMPGVDYVYVDGDKYYFVDFEGDHMELKNTNTIKQLHKLHGKSLGESVNEAYIVTYAKKKGEKPASAAFQLRGSALSFEKDLKKDGYITMITQKKVKGIDESVNESASKEAMGIAALTGTRGSAVQDFIDKNRINSKKLFKALKSANLQGRINFATALAGKDGNPNQKLTIKLFGESINEDYYKSASDAADAARKYAEKKGYEIDEEDWQTQIAMGGKHNRLRPGVGKTHSFSVGLTKNGKPQRKALNISLYGMDSGKFELTSYIN